ncbi:M23 family metallopeptidase [Curtobacterium sp. PhB115]|uniref:M23 family metallopeptidase n=1 Tax=Curtobacterium sp. PhB115 TaxID=2485173 RepID=UPI000F9FBBA5|nr:M23 family metallopeptidase [Curtobacterium sp. PhB115]ROP72532.1 murein DD-endopeptidase MepM/ murein hydrolase activator NlpD [Curtobacterium sp. PhB115]
MTTTAPDSDPQPGTPVVHLSRRAALEAERAAARKPERAAARKPERKPGRRATAARATTEHVDARITHVVRRPAVATSVAVPTRASRQQPTRAGRTPRTTRWIRSNRASRITLTSAVAAVAMFAASAMPAHAAAGTSIATSTIAPIVRTQDYAVTQAVTATGLDRDGFTVGGGSNGTAGTSVSYGGAVRSPFPGPVKMSSGFGYRSAPCGACSSLHQGLDFTPGMGTPIGAVAAGTVRVSGTYFSYGNAVIIDHVIDGRQVSTLYGHMIPGSSPLKVGDEVDAGQFIGLVGSSGVSTGAHLHLEVLMDGVTPIDPEAWLQARIGRSLTA